MSADIVDLVLDDFNKVKIHFHANFGPWNENRPQHGFARIKRWKVKDTATKTVDSASISFSLVDDEETRQLWNHNFELAFRVVLTTNNLNIQLEVSNIGSEEFDFTCLFHAYYQVDDIAKVKVYGLQGVEFIDKVNGMAKGREDSEYLAINQEFDRIYISTNQVHKVETGSSMIRIEKENFPDSDVWNPWAEKSKGIADFDDEEYRHMICVQAGYLNKRYLLKSNESVKMGQTITVQYY